MIRDADGRIARIRYAMPRHWVILWAASWVGSYRPGLAGLPAGSQMIDQEVPPAAR